MNSIAYDIDKHWKFRQYAITFQIRSKNNLWGRFGGGWDYEIGVQWGASSVIFNLLIGYLRIDRRKLE